MSMHQCSAIMQESCQVLADVRGDEGAYDVTYNVTYNVTYDVTYLDPSTNSQRLSSTQVLHKNNCL